MAGPMNLNGIKEAALGVLLVFNLGYLSKMNDKLDILMSDSARKTVQVESHEVRLTYVEHYYLKPDDLKFLQK